LTPGNWRDSGAPLTRSYPPPGKDPSHGGGHDRRRVELGRWRSLMAMSRRSRHPRWRPEPTAHPMVLAAAHPRRAHPRRRSRAGRWCCASSPSSQIAAVVLDHGQGAALRAGPGHHRGSRRRSARPWPRCCAPSPRAHALRAGPGRGRSHRARSRSSPVAIVAGGTALEITWPLIA
jgi:hypothetical protein